MITQDSGISWGMLIWGGGGGQKAVGLKINVYEVCDFLVPLAFVLLSVTAVP